METRVAILEERQLQDRRRMDQLERQSEKDIEKLGAIIKDTELRIMAVVRAEFATIEKTLTNVVSASKEIKEEQAKLAAESAEQKTQTRINESQTATALFFIAGLVGFAEILLRYVL